jgi:hypothetical protein
MNDGGEERNNESGFMPGLPASNPKQAMWSQIRMLQ